MACSTCRRRSRCSRICSEVQKLLPKPSEGRFNYGHRDIPDLERIYCEMTMSRIIVDYRHSLTGMQLLVVNLYYNDSLSESEISNRLGISQKCVHTYLKRAYRKIRNLAMR